MKNVKKIYQILFITMLTAFLSSAVIGQTSKSTFQFQKESKIWLEGTSTLHDFTITAKEFKSDLTIENSDDSKNEFKISKLELIVPVKKLDSEKESMDENLQEAMDADNNPNIIFTLTSASKILLNNKGDSTKIAAVGNLKIAGVTKLVNLDISVLRLDENKFEFKGNKKLLMTDYNVDPPSMFLGTLKTADEIYVNFNLILNTK
ncbi:MAG: YceI family protein [Ignavibacteriaceae bacterium]